MRSICGNLRPSEFVARSLRHGFPVEPSGIPIELETSLEVGTNVLAFSHGRWSRPNAWRGHGDLAISRYFTPHDVPFGDLVFFAATNWKVPLDGTSRTATNFGIGPGTRFHITRNFFFLHYWEFPLAGPHLNKFTVQFDLLNVFLSRYCEAPLEPIRFIDRHEPGFRAVSWPGRSSCILNSSSVARGSASSK